MDKAEQKWLSMEICPKCGKDLRTHRDHAGYIDQAICMHDNCNFKYSEATNDSTAVIKEILEFIYNYGVLGAQPQDEFGSHLHQICSALHSQIKNKFLAVRSSSAGMIGYNFTE
ncbi:MAG: hypothetical protein GY804_00980 [Alphaproteobacteria bacterium]|nr:hypothetical protein [Alphaproteobacteria bacterium]